MDGAIAMAQDAAEGMLAMMAEQGEDLPSEPEGAIVARVAVVVSALAPA